MVLVCKFCDSKFVLKRKLTQHAKKCTKSCAYCKKGFSCLFSLKRHMSSYHQPNVIVSGKRKRKEAYVQPKDIPCFSDVDSDFSQDEEPMTSHQNAPPNVEKRLLDALNNCGNGNEIMPQVQGQTTPNDQESTAKKDRGQKSIEFKRKNRGQKKIWPEEPEPKKTRKKCGKVKKKNIQCPLCKKLFLHSRSLTRHLESQICKILKKRNEDNTCEICNKTFSPAGYVYHKTVAKKCKSATVVDSMETNINREITEEVILVEDPVAEVFPSEEPIPKKNLDFLEAASADEEAGVKLEIKEEITLDEDPLSIHGTVNVEEPEAHYEEEGEDKIARPTAEQKLYEHRPNTIYIAQHNINTSI